ncbi:MAG: DUF4055 domain-containing protein [Nitrosomonas sp.]|nr:DUF4055 domain-containing protein [Nitrosomonas sp.]
MIAKVDSISSAVEAMSQNWPIAKALMGGTAAIRKEGKTYLPQWPNESDESYRARLTTATLYPAFKRTVEVLAAKPFSKALKLSDNVPARMVPWLDDIDLQGRNLQAFASVLMDNCIGYGVSGVLIDYPKAEGIATVADEKASGARPYFVHYQPGTVLGWRTERVNGADKLVQLRLKECKLVADGDFGEVEVEQIRVLTPGAWQLWRKNEKKEWALSDEGTTTLKEIPFVAFYGNRTGFMTGEPPLIELAYQNVEHYQSSSDQQTILHVARVPILSIIGGDEKAITVGTSTAVNLPHGADMKFVEHSGAAIGAGRTSLLDLEERMRQTGAELLVLQPGQITATQVHSENEANKCALQRITENFEDALDQCLQFMADWVGEAEGGNVELFKDFGAASLSDASAQLLLQTNQAGKISDQTLMSEYKRRGILAADLDFESEQERISEQGPALGMVGVE